MRDAQQLEVRSVKSVQVQYTFFTDLDAAEQR